MYSMTKSILFLLLTAITPLAIADLSIPSPPQTLSSTDINNNEAANILVKKIHKLLTESESEKTNANIILSDSQQIILLYEYTYGWRATDRAVQTLIYKKNNQNWSLTTTLEGNINPKSFIGDLNGDGISELLVIKSGGFRNMMEESQTIMLFDTATKNYVKSNLVANTMAISGECNDVENTYEKISIKKSQPVPIIIINKEIKNVSKTDCTEKTVSTTMTEYSWSSTQKKFIPLSNNSSLWNWITSWL